MEEFKKRLIFLCHYKGITWNEIYRLLKNDPLLLNQSYLSPKFISGNLLNQINDYSLKGIKVMTYFDDDYPQLLKEIYQPPWCLFLKGNDSILNQSKKLAIVGSRESTSYSKKVLDHILPSLVAEKIIIVSGLAKGVDSLAHRVTIEYGGQTIAVIAGGFNNLYPKENEVLAGKIGLEHLLISEYPPETKPEKWHFPARNRIISGISKGTIVIEAKRKSGSLITANYAVQEGREVFAVPGSIFSPYSDGTNELVQQGAKLVMCGKDIIEELKW